MMPRKLLRWVIVLSEFVFSGYFCVVGTIALWEFRHGSTADDFGLGEAIRLGALVLLVIAVSKCLAAFQILRERRWAWWLGLGPNLLIVSVAAVIHDPDWWSNWLSISCALLVVFYLAMRTMEWSGSKTKPPGNVHIARAHNARFVI